MTELPDFENAHWILRDRLGNVAAAMWFSEASRASPIPLCRIAYIDQDGEIVNLVLKDDGRFMPASEP